MSNRPAFAQTIQAETGLTDMLIQHFGAALGEPRNDACSHPDVYTGLQGTIAVLAGAHASILLQNGVNFEVFARPTVGLYAPKTMEATQASLGCSPPDRMVRSLAHGGRI